MLTRAQEHYVLRTSLQIALRMTPEDIELDEVKVWWDEPSQCWMSRFDKDPVSPMGEDFNAAMDFVMRARQAMVQVELVNMKDMAPTRYNRLLTGVRRTIRALEHGEYPEDDDAPDEEIDEDDTDG